MNWEIIRNYEEWIKIVSLVQYDGGTPRRYPCVVARIPYDLPGPSLKIMYPRSDTLKNYLPLATESELKLFESPK